MSAVTHCLSNECCNAAEHHLFKSEIDIAHVTFPTRKRESTVVTISDASRPPTPDEAETKLNVKEANE
jgi:hypothetical protein